MGRCVEKLPHSCGSSDGLQVFEEGGRYSGYCFVCSTPVPNPYESHPEGYVPPKKISKSPEEIAAKLEEIATYQQTDLPTRHLKRSTVELFGVRVGVSRQDGSTPEVAYYPYYNEKNQLSGYKAKLLPEKRMWGEGSLKDIVPFNWPRAASLGRKRLFITEGEEDAMAALQMLMRCQEGTKFEGIEPAVISIPSGAGSAVASLSKIAPDIRRLFAEVVLIFDQDAEGEKATKDVVIKVLPDAKVAVLPKGMKDANDCLKNGHVKAFYSAVQFQAEVKKNSRLIWGSELHEAAKKAAEWGVSWPWQWMTDKTRGIRKGETIYIGAAPKMGHFSLLFNSDLAHLKSL